jgi:large subunit ribosomal protein L29
MSKWKEALSRIRDLPDDELGQARERAREELFRLRLGNYTNQVENTVSLRLKRRELARILTIERARDLAIEAQTHAARPAEEQQDEEPQTVADRARAAVGRPRPKAKGAAKKAAASSRKSPAKPAAKPAARSASKAKAGAKSSKKKSGKE